MCQRQPADPTDPGDAADLSIMGYSECPACPPRRFHPLNVMEHLRKSL